MSTSELGYALCYKNTSTLEKITSNSKGCGLLTANSIGLDFLTQVMILTGPKLFPLLFITDTSDHK